ncbi:ankyrin [Hypoxylon sp. NC1633]|nr:ankyrin [Hypoxylon sp. NC1633]
MEVVGAIASFISIGQALAAAPKILDTLRSVSETKQDIIELLNEVAFLDTLGVLIRETIDRLPNNGSASNFRIPHPALLPIVESDLKSVVSQLQQITQEYQHLAKGNSKINVSTRVKWHWKKRKIISLTRKAKSAREYLQLILTCNSALASTHNGQMLVDILAIVTTQGHPGIPSPLPVQTNVTAIPRQLTMANIANETSLQDLPSEEKIQNHEPLVQVTAALRRVCAKGCACQCHSPASRNRQAPATLFVNGWLNYAYNSVSRLATRRCDVSTCQRAHSPVHLNLRFPLMFCSRTLEASLSFGGVVGVGASLHLRVQRVIKSDDDIWWEIHAGKIELVRRRFSRREFSPFDKDQTDSIFDVSSQLQIFQYIELVVTLYQYAIIENQYEMVSMFLQESMSILQGTDFGKSAAIQARYILSYKSLDERQIAFWQRVIALADQDMDDRWPIHEAVRGRGDLIATLCECPESINAVDNSGRTPLHWAVKRGDSSLIQTLASYGADLDTRDWEWNTPLMYAATKSDCDCATALLNAGCDINIHNRYGLTAIHFAVRSSREGSAEVVSLLIDRGAQLDRGFDHGNALHSLASYPDCVEAEEKFQLLIEAGAELEGKDKFGSTPLTTAIRKNHTAAIRLLIDAGCKLLRSPDWLNMLHTTARYAGAKSMDILEEAQFTVDVRVWDNDGDTPLDTFEWRMEKETSSLPGDMRSPDDEDIALFQRFLGNTRDRYLKAEIQKLETAIEHLRAQNNTLAREALQPIIQEKVHWNIPAELRTFRAIDLQIRNEMTEAAIESLEEFIEVSKERIGTDPFEGDYCRRSSLRDPLLAVLVSS